MRSACAAALAIGLMLGACAAHHEPPPPRASVNIFISPAGEPFRAGANDPYPLDVWFARADANHDGAITEEELLADARGFFRKLDLDHNGLISGDELSDYEQNVAPDILPRIGRLTGADIPPLPDTAAGQKAAQEKPPEFAGARVRSIPAGLGAAIFSLTPEPEPVSAADTDFDGKVSEAEFLAAVRRRFALLDKNHDGRLTRAELPDTMAKKLGDQRLEYEKRRGK